MKRPTLSVAGVASALVLAFVPAATANHEGPGEPREGSKFQLFTTAQDDVDPQNEFNEVISFDTSPPAVVRARRKQIRVKIATMDNQIGLNYHFVGRTCGGGGPRVSLSIDANGDGKFIPISAGGPTSRLTAT